jgi:hypothetical protein
MTLTDNKTRFIVYSTAVVAISLLYFFVDARVTNLLPKCPFHSITGLYCPGCGSQRALSSLLHLDIAAATRYNLLMVVSLPLITYSAYAAWMNTFTQVKVHQKLFHSVAFIWMLAVVVVVFAILRNIPYYPFNLLAPRT